MSQASNGWTFCITFAAMGFWAAMAQANTPKAIIIGPSGGGQVELQVQIPLKEGQHIYDAQAAEGYISTSVQIRRAGPVEWSAPIYPPTKMLQQAGESFKVFEPQGNESLVTIRFTGQVLPSTQAGRYPISVIATWQACTDTMCLPPERNRLITAEMVVEDDVQAVGEQEDSGLPSAMTSPAESGGQSGYGTQFEWFGVSADMQKLPVAVALALAMLAGLILNVMPCVLPVLPLKAMQLIQEADREGRSAKIIGLFFAAGVISFFLAIGVAAVATHGALSWGRQFQSVVFLQAMAAVMVWLAMGMFGVYLVQPANVGGKSGHRHSYFKAIVTGWIAGVISTPCSFGLLGAAVVWAQLQPAAVTLLAFSAMGVGMALPVVAVTIWPVLLNWIPRSGVWAERVKQAMGFVLLAVAAFFVAAVPGERVGGTLYLLIAVAAACWLWGSVQYSEKRWVWVIRMLAIGGIVAAGWPARDKASVDLPWTPLTQASLAESQASGKTVVVEFTAEWCLNCKTVEKVTFGDGRVREALQSQEVILLKGDHTSRNPFSEQLLKEWSGQTGIPFTVVIREGRKELLPGIYGPGDLLKALGRE